MVRVLYVLNDTIKYGGTEAVVLNYYNHINRNEIQIDFMIHTTQEEALGNQRIAELKKTGCNIFVVTPRRISVKQNREDIRKVLNNYSYDIIHSHCDCANYLICKLAKEMGIKVRISHSHNTAIPIEKKGIKGTLHYYYLDFCRHMVKFVATDFMACSKEAAIWLYGKDNLNRTYILNNAIDSSKYGFNEEKRLKVRAELGIADDEILLGHVGSFLPQKNHEFLLKIFECLYQKNNKYKLLLLGDGPLKNEMIKRIEGKLFSENVIFYGVADSVSDKLQAMDMFVFPSLFEGLSVALVEAQCSGLKCFVTDSERISKQSFITDNITAIEENNLEKWSNIISECDYSNRHSCSEVIVKKGYDICSNAKLLQEYYKNLV